MNSFIGQTVQNFVDFFKSLDMTRRLGLIAVSCLLVAIMAGIVIKSRLGPAALYYMDPRPIRRSLKILARRYKRDLRPLRNLYTFGSPHNPLDRWS